MVNGKGVESGNAKTGRYGSSDVVCEAIREDIVSGRINPGSKLPTHIELAGQFNVSNVTIQNALGRLSDEGFVDVRPRMGSFVREKPPHIGNIALVFPLDPQVNTEYYCHSKFYQILQRVADRVQEELGISIEVFQRVDYHADSKDYRTLNDYIERSQLAGIIFGGPSYMLRNTQLCRAPGLPRVEFAPATDQPWPVFDATGEEWYHMALDFLQSRGRRRVALLMPSIRGSDFFRRDRWESLVGERDMFSPVRWHQVAKWTDPYAAANLVQLLMHGGRDERPDALLITDDNLLEGAMNGLLASGVRVPEDVEVIFKANFPMPAPPVLPVRPLGYDQKEILMRTVELIDAMRRGEDTPSVIGVSPQWYTGSDSVKTSASKLTYVA